MIHPGEYNTLKVWDYAGLANSLSNGDGTTFAVKVRQIQLQLRAGSLPFRLTESNGLHEIANSTLRCMHQRLVPWL